MALSRKNCYSSFIFLRFYSPGKDEEHQVRSRTAMATVRNNVEYQVELERKKEHDHRPVEATETT